MIVILFADQWQVLEYLRSVVVILKMTALNCLKNWNRLIFLTQY